MSKFNNEEQKLIDFFNRKEGTPSKKFERNLDKAMQESLLAKNRGFFASFSLYFASIAIVVFAGVLSASLLYVFSNSSSQNENNIRFLSDSEKAATIQKINKNNINFLKIPERIENEIDSEENTIINKTTVTYDYSSVYFPTCFNQEKIQTYNIYSYTEADDVYVKEEIITAVNSFEKITKNSETPRFFINGEETLTKQPIFNREDINYNFSFDSLVFNTETNRYLYRTSGGFQCERLAGPTAEQTPVSFSIEDTYFENYSREVYVNELDFKISNEIIKKENSTQIYFEKRISNSTIDATIRNLLNLFRI